MALLGEVISTSDLSRDDIERMFQLMDLHFDGMDRKRFDEDLKEKESVLILRHPDNSVIQGFSTSMCIDTEVEGVPVRAIYSGDTIINREYWGEKTLGTIWLRHVLKVQKSCPDRRVFWFLISMGYKTYRLMRLFFKDYWPRYSAETPSFEQALIDHLGKAKFGENYKTEGGIISFNGTREKLRCGVADVDEAKRKDRDIAFFVNRNPRWIDGDELVCVAEIHRNNLRPRMWRIFNLEKQE